MKKNPPHIVKTTFVVSGGDLNAQSVLQLCRILSLTTEHTDAAIQMITGALDFSRINMRHFNLNIEGEARLYDVVVFQSYVYVVDDEQVAVTLRATTRRKGRTMPPVNGSFLFAVVNGVPVSYSLS